MARLSCSMLLFFKIYRCRPTTQNVHGVIHLYIVMRMIVTNRLSVVVKMVFHFQMRGNYPQFPHLAPKAYFIRNLIHKAMNHHNVTMDNISTLTEDIEDKLVMFQNEYGPIDWMQDIYEVRSFIANNIDEAKQALELVPSSEVGYRPHEYHFFALLNHPYLPRIIGVEFLIRPPEDYFSDSDSPYHSINVYH